MREESDSWTIFTMETSNTTERWSKDVLSATVKAAIAGDRSSWTALIDNFTPLVFSVMRRYRLDGNDAADASQNVWLAMVKYLKFLKEPAALPGWIVTCARNEALRVLVSRRRVAPVDPQACDQLDRAEHVELDEQVFRMERRRAVHAGIGELRLAHRRLLQLLISEPDLSYREIGHQLGMPVGSVGPTRARSLQRLGQSEAIRRLVS